MKVRKFGKILTIFLCVALMFLAIPFSFSSQFAFAESSPAETISDENFTSETRSDENFAMTMTATGRQNAPLPKVLQPEGDGKNTYLCFQWRDLKRLNFHITAENRSLKEGQYFFKVTHSISPDLNSQAKTIYDGNVGDFIMMDLFYNIDSTIEGELPAKNFAGNDFGLYRFDFVYTWNVSGEMKERSLGSAIYVSVLPDANISERLQQENVQMLYSVSSSNELINVINLSLSGDALKYVEPSLITWVAYGTGTDNVKYCLTQEMKDLDSDLSNYAVIWETYKNQHGTTFVLDTKEIEGVWHVYCIVKDYNGQEFRISSTEELSTIKIQPKNWFWLIMLVVGIGLVMLLIIALVIVFVMKKREKVW